MRIDYAFNLIGEKSLFDFAYLTLYNNLLPSKTIPPSAILFTISNVIS